MKLFILLSSAVLFATAITPISAYADDNSINCRRLANGCDIRNNGGSEKISINGLDIEVRSFDRGNRNAKRDFSVKVVSDNGGKKGVKDINARRSNKGKKDVPVVDTPVVDAPVVDTPVVDNGTNTPVVDNSSNAPVVNHNNNNHNHNNWADEGYNPYRGLYGPGT